MIYKINHWWHTLFPFTCQLCLKLSDLPYDLCLPCKQKLPWLHNVCKRCALPLTEFTSTACGHCLRTPPAFDQVISLFHYRPPIQQMINRLKFHHGLHHAKLFSVLLLEKIQSLPTTSTLPSLIIPMPLHKQRLKERGFNQAILLARPLAKALQIPLSNNLVTRIRATAPQATLQAEMRKRNIKKAFSINAPIAHDHVALIDDVVTTASTTNELSVQLKKQGAKQVDIWCIARAS